MDPYGMSAEELAQACGVDNSTARKWKRRGRIPTRYHRLLQLNQGGDLGALTGRWKGWRIQNGELFSPEGVGVMPGEIRSIPYREHQISELKRQLRKVTESASSWRRPMRFTLHLDLDPAEAESPNLRIHSVDTLSLD